jgi:hypothetical protein
MLLLFWVGLLLNPFECSEVVEGIAELPLFFFMQTGNPS